MERLKYAQERAAKVNNPRLPQKSLSDWCREANECNLDYGTYRALIAQGKTFDELKSLADNRGYHAHARAPQNLRHGEEVK